MTNKYKRGFTLIELLVVVLIIGILAAVALPQYTAAVEKSRAMTLLSSLSSIARAEEVYYMANGKYTSDLYALDVNPPSGGKIENEKIAFPNGNVIALWTGASGYLASGTGRVQIDVFFEHGKSHSSAGIFCYAKAGDSVSMKICQTLGTPTGFVSRCGMLTDTPPCKEYRID